MKRLRTGRVEVALHTLREGAGPDLLLVHGLHDDARSLAKVAAPWPGRAFGIDLVGHGASDRVRGGSYYPETLACSVDAALAELGEAYLAGVGLGAYLALLVAGARAEVVPGVYLLPGAGLEGGGPEPDWDKPVDEIHAELAATLGLIERDVGALPDPMVESCLRDPRPPDYAVEYAEAAARVLLGEDAGPRPPWWHAVRDVAGTESASTDPAAGFAQLLRRA